MAAAKRPLPPRSHRREAAPRAERPAKYLWLHSPCGQDFSTIGSFDAHLVGEYEFTYSEGLKMDPPREDGYRCLSVSEMEEAGWDKDKRGRWRAPGNPKGEEDEPGSFDRVVL